MCPVLPSLCLPSAKWPGLLQVCHGRIRPSDIIIVQLLLVYARPLKRLEKTNSYIDIARHAETGMDDGPELQTKTLAVAAVAMLGQTSQQLMAALV